jgi:hypothetical protein
MKENLINATQKQKVVIPELVFRSKNTALCIEARK